ncbi:ferrirhodotorulic acid ABC transporter, ATP-binding protein [Campylobacter subantarcticus LMG 24377]|uniref:Ferrirhodotorulic acid ABC transporter, ATP-binding protein n=2 Tax=Campylobacter subantarcticus TaxID=497724 RepID=A0A0A8HAQ8_9BACT|nr:ABC transporter ATP-binding protein [Campylobacter subantarcticus]EAJ1261449.1 ABC transporter ATP-binding protein [Campylobacter lari]AJC91171.1 ferrirhodotorulic acid ABC transporter, ATP-binding protein [Campylobacter subantarcticus LMG 24374]AJC92946.1 ferrirhodotorulic acid ABC transporter, ATP-binding protein [Campylobacter subantarcticus LMG 24377]EAL3938832.1 ABC transporter ATP-binding protein [Campylobacter lari]MPB99830.1 ABC transporter ATP-binding protein [Campylobacter subanta
MKNIIKISNLNRNFNEVKALQDINLEVKQGEWLAIMGPSGSGKSTLLNILSLMDTQSSGEYFLDDKEVGNLSEEEKSVIRREKIGLIFQQFHLIPYLNALENVMLAQFYHSSIEQKDAMIALEKVGLSHRLTHLPSQLSGGEQQRLCIARALVNDPEILLADEPTGNLDEANEKNILDLFCKLKQDGKTIVLITHNPDLATFADRTIILSHGAMKSEN